MSNSHDPAVMQLDRHAWFRQLNLSNFVNTYCQYRDVEKLGNCRTILIVGPGQGLDTIVLRWRGFQVTTFDLDETFHPDVIGSVHSMAFFADQQFDLVIASHVLEHLPVRFLDASLSELARVAKSALIYLPVAGRHGMLRLIAGIRNIDVSIVWDVFNWFRRPSGETPSLCEGQHYWEIGWRGYRTSDVRRMLAKHFILVEDYRNRDWLPSYNFVLRSRQAAKAIDG